MEAKEFIKKKFKYLGTVNKIESEIIDFEFNDLCDLLTEFASQDKWIPVEDKLPEIADRVLVCCKHGVFVASYEDEGDWAVDAFNIFLSIVTHWMPLPEPPKF